MYKLIALDMDGTVLKEDKTISHENYKAIQEAKANGIKVVLATGRPVKGIENYLKELNLDEKGDYAVTFNGAMVQDTESGDILANNIMSLDDLHYLNDLSNKLGVHIHALTPNNVITSNKDISDYTVLESYMNQIHLDYVDFNNLSEDTKIVKVMLIDHEEILEEAIKKLPKELYENYTVVRSAPYFLEILNKKANKGSGVELLAKKLGISKNEVICIGDAGNDIHMIEYAGLGVAMGNAFPEIKKIANYVTKTNEEHGVAHVINKFVLDKETAV